MKIHRTFKNHQFLMLAFVQIYKAIINYIFLFLDPEKSSQFWESLSFHHNINYAFFG